MGGAGKPHERYRAYACSAYPARSPASVSVEYVSSFGAVPLRSFSLRGQLGPDLRFAPAANLYAETVCATVPNYGPELTFTGICNPKGVLAASGTFVSNGYRGTANVRPAERNAFSSISSQ